MDQRRLTEVLSSATGHRRRSRLASDSAASHRLSAIASNSAMGQRHPMEEVSSATVAGGGSRALRRIGRRLGYRRHHSPDRRATGGGHRDERNTTRSRSPEGNLRGDNRGRVEDRRHQVHLSSSEYEAFQKFLGRRCS